MRPGPRIGCALLTALVVAGLVGAKPAVAIEVVAPANGQTVTWMPTDLVVEFDASADEATLSVHLNGTDVTAYFTLEPPQGGLRTARAEDLFGTFVLIGPNSVIASIEVASVPEQDATSFAAIGDPYGDEVVSYVQGTSGGFNSGNLAVILGAPQGSGLFQGSLDVVSLGFSGEVVVAFRDNRIIDGPGPDFTVFENSFLEIGAGSLTAPPFAEPGLVSVSQDGQTWHAFDSCPLTDTEAGPYWTGCAGIFPTLSSGTAGTPHASIPTTVPIEDLIGVPILSLIPPSGGPPAGAGGNSFDLADVGLSWARYVKVVAASYATGPVGANNAGFDIEAVAAIHSQPEVSAVPALSSSGRALLLTVLCIGGRVTLRGRKKR